MDRDVGSAIQFGDDAVRVRFCHLPMPTFTLSHRHAFDARALKNFDSGEVDLGLAERVCEVWTCGGTFTKALVRNE